MQKILAFSLFLVASTLVRAEETYKTFSLKSSDFEVYGNFSYLWKNKNQDSTEILQFSQTELKANLINSQQNFASVKFALELFFTQNNKFLGKQVYEIFSEQTNLPKNLEVFTTKNFENLTLKPNQIENAFEFRLADIVWTQKIDFQKLPPEFIPNKKSLVERVFPEKMGKKEFEKALLHFTKVVRNEPENSSAYFKRGENFFNQELFQNALDDFTKAIELDPNYKEAFLLRGILYERQEKFEFALNDFNSALKIDKNYEEAYVNRAYLNFKLDFSEDAVKDFSEALRINETDESYTNRGCCYFNLKSYELALADFSKAIELEKDNLDALFNRGTLLGFLGKNELAIVDLTSLIEKNPNFVEAFINRGNFYLELKDYTKAEDDFRQSLVLEPSYNVSHYNFALALVGNQKYRDAIWQLKKYLENEPTDTEAQKMLENLKKLLNK
ncbi:tetratricopeptide repeat protein [bacterium]|nr:tetratricopeptide repeat protein [bacterium]